MEDSVESATVHHAGDAVDSVHHREEVSHDNDAPEQIDQEEEDEDEDDEEGEDDDDDEDDDEVENGNCLNKNATNGANSGQHRNGNETNAQAQHQGTQMGTDINGIMMMMDKDTATIGDGNVGVDGADGDSAGSEEDDEDCGGNGGGEGAGGAVSATDAGNSEATLNGNSAGAGGDGAGDEYENNVDYRVQYIGLKKKLKFLLYENEFFQDALRSSQRRLLKVTRDRSFLLDRLLQYEKPDVTTSESDADTESSDDESATATTSGSRGIDATIAKRRKTMGPPNHQQQAISNTSTGGNGPTAMNTAEHIGTISTSVSSGAVSSISSMNDATSSTTSTMTTHANIEQKVVAAPGRSLPVAASTVAQSTLLSQTKQQLQVVPQQRRKKISTKKSMVKQVLNLPVTAQPRATQQAALPTQQQQHIHHQHVVQQQHVYQTASSSGRTDGHMTAAEVERHLQSRQTLMELVPERAPPTMPTEIFSNEPSMDSSDVPDQMIMITTTTATSTTAATTIMPSATVKTSSPLSSSSLQIVHAHHSIGGAARQNANVIADDCLSVEY